MIKSLIRWRKMLSDFSTLIFNGKRQWAISVRYHCMQTTSKEKRTVNKYWTMINNMHVEVFGRGCTDVYYLFLNISKIRDWRIDRVMDRWIGMW